MATMMLFGMSASRQASLHPNQKTSFYKWEVMFPLLLFAVIFGMRYNVGVDHLDYLQNYKTENFHNYDLIFKWISQRCVEYDLHYTFYFGILAFIPVFLLFYTFKDERYLFPYLAFVLFTGQYFWHWMNVIRQDIAACIFLYASRYIADKKFWKYFICYLLACGFHRTAILLLPIYPILRGGRDFFKNIPLQLGLLLTVSVVAILEYDLVSFFNVYIEQFKEQLNYRRYSEEILYGFTEITRTGFRFYCFLIIDIIIILYSKKLKNYYKTAAFKVFYNLYYFGAITQILFTTNLVLARPFRYFRYFMLVISAQLLYFLYNKRTKTSFDRIALLILLLMLSLLFYAIIARERSFTFFWQAIT